MSTMRSRVGEQNSSPGFEAGFTHYLKSWQNGDNEAYEKMFELVFDEIRLIASRELRRRGGRHTWKTTDLANEIVVRLLKYDEQQWNNREHFLNTAALAMFQILIDYGRRKQRRVHGMNRVHIEDMDGNWNFAAREEVLSSSGLEKIIDIQNAFRKLALVNRRMAAIALMRMNFGMKSDEIADHLGIAANTVNNLWPKCKRFLARELEHWNFNNND